MDNEQQLPVSEVSEHTEKNSHAKRRSFAWILHLTYVSAFLIVSYSSYLMHQDNIVNFNVLGNMLDKQRSKSIVLEGQLDSLQQQLTHFQHTDLDWTLKEAQYLFHAAQMRLSLLDDAPTALLQLQAAQTKLNKLADPALLPVRQQLAKDIGALQAYRPVDREAIWLELTSLGQGVAKMNIANSQQVGEQLAEIAQNNTSSPELESDDSWKGALNQSWDELKSMVRVKHHDQPQVAMVLDVADRQHLQQAGLSLIEQAKWAVLNQNTVIYQESLGALSQIFQGLIGVDNGHISPLEKLVNKLQAVDITSHAPTLSVVAFLPDEHSS